MEDNYYEVENQKVDKTHKLSDVSNWKGILLFLFAYIGLSLIVYSSFFKIAKCFFDIDPITRTPVPLYYQVDSVLQFSTYAIAIAIACLIVGLPSIKSIFKHINIGRKYGRGAMYGAILYGVQIAYSMITTLIFGEYGDNDNQKYIIELTKTAPILMFFTTVIFAPLFEETAYRYGIFGCLHKKNRILAYVCSSFLFGLAHFNTKCFTEEYSYLLKSELINLPIYIISGLILAFAYEKEESLISPIVTHAMNNFVAFTQILMFYM